jgi:hypothetical protein
MHGREEVKMKVGGGTLARDTLAHLEAAVYFDRALRNIIVVAVSVTTPTRNIARNAWPITLQS